MQIFRTRPERSWSSYTDGSWPIYENSIQHQGKTKQKKQVLNNHLSISLSLITALLQVYGVALYVSKRDVLADPAMAPFASKSSEELRQSKDFFAVLRHMASSGHANGGRFDRTLFIKTNMQLTVETMQNSLKADWKLLTDEAKSTLIGSSMKSRPANEAMMEVIKSPDNPSRCSCAQTAPEEYNADLSCCARGTELVFTWRKDGQLEVSTY